MQFWITNHDGLSQQTVTFPFLQSAPISSVLAALNGGWHLARGSYPSRRFLLTAPPKPMMMRKPRHTPERKMTHSSFAILGFIVCVKGWDFAHNTEGLLILLHVFPLDRRGFFFLLSIVLFLRRGQSLGVVGCHLDKVSKERKRQGWYFIERNPTIYLAPKLCLQFYTAEKIRNLFSVFFG